jgi:small ligand-binding sensory domain FIST
LRVHARIPLLAGCSSNSLICGPREIEDAPGITLGLYHFPGGRIEARRFTQAQVEEADGPAYWHLELGLPPGQVNGWLAFADPFHLDCESWLRQWNEAYAPLPIAGGLASGEPNEQRTQIYLNGEMFEEGGVAIALAGETGLVNVISQGCTPIGETWTITRVEKNFIHEIGNRPAYQVLVETYNRLSAEEQEKAKGNLFVGLVVNEYLDEFRRGDFLDRNLIGADPQSGAIVVGALAATEDMEVLLARASGQLQGRTILGGCLCNCNGRGHRLFGTPSHDAEMIQKKLKPPGLTGFFCNGEIGPVGNRNFLHGYTASLSLFTRVPA